MLDRLKIRLSISDDREDDLLIEVLESAKALFLMLRYPTSSYPVNEHDEPIIEVRYNDWILRCAIEMYSRIGAEGQMVHNENSINRAYESGTISDTLRMEIVPIAGLVRGGGN